MGQNGLILPAVVFLALCAVELLIYCSLRHAGETKRPSEANPSVSLEMILAVKAAYLEHLAAMMAAALIIIGCAMANYSVAMIVPAGAAFVLAALTIAHANPVTAIMALAVIIHTGYNFAAGDHTGVCAVLLIICGIFYLWSAAKLVYAGSEYSSYHKMFQA